MKIHSVRLSLLCMLACVLSLLTYVPTSYAQTQTPLPNTQTFAVATSVVALPGGKSTVAATDSGFTFAPSTKFDLFESNLISPAAPSGLQGFSDFLGGFDYWLPALSVKLNNESPNANILRFRFGLTGAVGVDRVTDATGNVRQHWSAFAGGRIDYDLTGSGSWTLGVKAGFLNAPGLANHTAIVELSPAFHF